MYGAATLPRGLADAIETAITASEDEWRAVVQANVEDEESPYPLAVKYVPAKFAATYRDDPQAKLFIGSSNFTWGRGVYVTGIEQPLSTAIYGRVGIVARFDPTGWRAFDARDPANEQLYLWWLQAQIDYPEAVLTVHSDHWLHKFRNLFREDFHIGVVLFHPDERDRPGWYTRPDDTWMAVSDWNGGDTLMTGYSDCVPRTRLTILIEEEFTADKSTLTRLPQFAISGAAPAIPPNLPAAARAAYAANTIERVPS